MSGGDFGIKAARERVRIFTGALIGEYEYKQH